jgi:hypothetical protein
MGYTVVYPSTDGLMTVGVGGVQLATASLMTNSNWNALFDSATMFAVHYDNQYICFTSKGNYLFDPQTGDLTSFTGISAIGGYHNLADGTLYLSTGSNVIKWEAGSALTMDWKSKLFAMPLPTNFGAAQVIADA